MANIVEQKKKNNNQKYNQTFSQSNVENILILIISTYLRVSIHLLIFLFFNSWERLFLNTLNVFS